jgi:hypothetical protein
MPLVTPGGRTIREQAPGELPGHTSARKIVATMSGAAGLVLALNLLALWFYSSGFAHSPVHLKWRLLLALDQPVEWLFIGDSSCYQSVLPSRVAATQGLAVNLCTNGSVLAVNDAWMLEIYLQHHAPPKRVVLVHVYDVWPQGYWPVVMAKIPLPWGFWERLIPRMHVNAMDEVKMFVARWFPLYAERELFAQFARSPSLLKAKPRVDSNGEVRSEVPRDSSSIQRDLVENLRFVRAQRFTISTPNQQALARVRELAETYGFNVYITSSPIHEQLYSDRAFRAHFAEVERMLCDYARSSNRVWYLGPPVAFPAWQLQNTVDHITYAASAEYTDTLVARVLTPPSGCN